MSIVIKICTCDGTGIVRRRVFNASNVTLAQVQEFANVQNNKKFTWRDEDNDVIMLENQFDLQEAIAYAVEQKSSLRLIVDNNTGASAEPEEPNIESTPVRATSTTTSHATLSDMQSFVAKLSTNFSSSYKSCDKFTKSALASSKTFQAIQEDIRSSRGFLEAYVQHNRPIKMVMGVITRGALLWGILFGPSFWLLLSIVIAALLMPRNALTDGARAQTRILFGLFVFRTVSKLLFGLTCCVTPLLLFCGLGACILSRCKWKRREFNRILRKGRHRRNRRQRTSNDRSSTSQQEHADIETLRRIFPALNIEELKQAYMRHKDIQQTVLELSE